MRMSEGGKKMNYEIVGSFNTDRVLSAGEIENLIGFLSLQIEEPVDIDQEPETYSTSGIKLNIQSTDSIHAQIKEFLVAYDQEREKYTRLVWVETACENDQCEQFQKFKERHTLANKNGKGFYMCPECEDISTYTEKETEWEAVNETKSKPKA